jgi:colanic acid biosynthesis glycosyl transferase WcaI
MPRNDKSTQLPMKKTREQDRPHRCPLWIVSELYYPEETSTGYFLTKIAEGLASNHSVHVVCGQPNYSAQKVRASSREIHNGVVIRRCWATTWNKNIWPLRLINFLTISISIFLHLIFVLRHGDQVLVVTNPPFLPFLTHWACRVHGARCFLLIHDVYPEVLVAAGLLSPNSRITRFLERCGQRL